MNAADNRVALVLSDINAFRLIPGIHRMASRGRDYWMMDIHRPVQEVKALLQKWNPAGVIVEWLPEVTESILALNIPSIVTIGDPDHLTVPAIDVDDRRVGELAAGHLLGLSLSEFAFVGEPTHYGKQREAAFRARLKADGYNCHSLFRKPTIARKYIEHWHESRPDLVEWIRALPKPVGIFAAHDPVGRLVAETCRLESIRIPEEVAIIGANNDHHVCGLTYPPLSSIEIPWEEIGFESARQMEHYLETSNPLKKDPLLIAPLRVVPRRSSDYLSISQPEVARALEFIYEHAQSRIQVSDVVAASGVSRRHLERSFRQFLKCSILDSLTRVRVDLSKPLLRRLDLSIEQVAEYCGFGRNERFTIQFKKWVHCTPRDYRKRHIEAQNFNNDSSLP